MSLVKRARVEVREMDSNESADDFDEAMKLVPTCFTYKGSHMTHSRLLIWTVFVYAVTYTL